MVLPDADPRSTMRWTCLHMCHLCLASDSSYSSCAGECEVETVNGHPGSPRPLGDQPWNIPQVKGALLQETGTIGAKGDPDDPSGMLISEVIQQLCSLHWRQTKRLKETKRVSKLCALLVHPSCMLLYGDHSGIAHEPNPFFVPQNIRSSLRSRTWLDSYMRYIMYDNIMVYTLSIHMDLSWTCALLFRACI